MEGGGVYDLGELFIEQKICKRRCMCEYGCTNTLLSQSCTIQISQ